MSGLEGSGSMVSETSAAGLILDSNYKTEFVVLIIWSSLWLGALGWEVFLSLTFDYRLILETNWKSFLSATHSIAYYLSRYGMLSFITLFVRQSAAQSDDCPLTVVSTTAMLCVSVGATNLVFLLRTCAIWNMRWVAVIPLTITWLIILGFAITLPVVAKTEQLAGYCLWNTGGFFVGAALVSVAAFGMVCLILTIMKLNRSGWKSAARGLLPHSKPNLDSEDVSVMLVQRTTAYFAIQLILLIIVATVYFAGPMPYRLMNVVSFNAITSSMAGKIFRKSWRLTRYVDNGSFNRPPSYYQGWADEDDDDDAPEGTQTPPHSSMTRKKDADDFYVEGEFGSSKLTFHQQQTPASLFAAHHSLNRRESQMGEDAHSADDGADLESGRGGIEGETTAIATDYATQLRRKRSSNRRGGRGSHRGRRRPSTDPSPGNGRSAGLLQGEMEEVGPVIMSARVSSLKPRSSRRKIDLEATQQSTSERSEVYRPSIDQTLLPTSREDLNQAPIRNRLWLDSRAERARLETVNSPSAIAQSLLRPTSSSSILRAGLINSNSASVSYAPSTISSSNTGSSRTGKRLILENASEANERLHGFTWRYANEEDNHQRPYTSGFTEQRSVPELRRESITPTSRAAFLPSSPAIVTPSEESSKLDRKNFDFDAIRQSLQDMDTFPTNSSAGMMERINRLAIVSVPNSPTPIDIIQEEITSPRRREKSRAVEAEIIQAPRPKTAPSRPSSESIPQIPLISKPAPVAQVESTTLPSYAVSTSTSNDLDVLNAFRQVIEDDSIAIGSDRPRTSRGDRIGSRDRKTEEKDSNDTLKQTASIGSASSEPFSELFRPSTSHGGNHVKPFGFQSSSREVTPEPVVVVSAIEEQYRKLEAFVNSEKEEDDDEDDDASSSRTARASS